MNESASGIAAYIGALAWIPQIIRWVTQALSKPKLRVRVGGNLQAGHAGLGTALGLNVAISSEVKDALIDRVQAILIHERGDRRDLDWYLAQEHQTEMRNDSGERIQMSRTQSVLALKVSTQALAERFIAFIDGHAEGAILAAQSAASSAWTERRRLGAVDWAAFALEPIAQQVRVESERAFHWQEGRYVLQLRLSIVGRRDHVEKFEFNLARGEVDRIRQNLSFWADNLSAVLTGGAFPTWNFAYPTLSRRYASEGA